MKKFNEVEYAVEIANRILDTPNKDPDDEESVLARQFLRFKEAFDRESSQI